MAGSIITIILRKILGGAVLTALLIFSIGTAAAVAMRGQGLGVLSVADWSAVRFTLWQACFSAGLSVGIAIPIARALARQSFIGRQTLITLLGAPFILPVIVGVLGLLAVFGRAGWISGMLTWAGLAKLSIYGAPGVILAHVFFNLPLATRFLLQGWASVPAERFRVTHSLAASPWAYFRLIEWPVLRSVVPGAFLLIFLLCLTSFAVALAVGGGPKGTTIELAIYQAFRLDFDLGKAASLAVVQFSLCGSLAVLAFLVPLPQTNGLGLGRLPQRVDASAHRTVDAFWIIVAAAFLIFPLGAIFLRGVSYIPNLPHQVIAASLTSILIALISTVVCITMALSLALAFARRGKLARSLAEGIGVLGLATSPLVVGTGLFLIIFPYAHPMTFAVPITASVNAMMALPFALRVLMPAVRETYADYLHLRSSLNMTRWVWLSRIVLPQLRRPLGFAAGLAVALSMGDLGVIALFADPDLQTLPLMLYRLMGAYQMDQAAAVAVVLVVQSLALFWMFDRGGRGYVESK